MSTHIQHDGRRRLLVAAAVVLAVVGAVILAFALRAPAAEPPVAPERTTAESAPAVTTPSPGTDTGAVPTDPGAVAEHAVAEKAPPAADAAGAGPAGPSAPDAAPVPDPGPVMPASDPVALSIPSIGVQSDVLVPLALDADGVLPAPTDYALPGWYTGGPNPGQFGPAVIAGHVDGPDGPAVFYRLGELAAGATVEVTRADGRVARFVVDSVERYAKAEFPTSRVYGNTTDRAEIRLITCGGAFDRTTGHYVDNIVVFGHLVS